MQAMMLTGIRAMQMVELPLPEILNPHDVRIRLAAVGVCGSDVHYYTTGRIGSQVVQYPFAVGHECAGVVDAVGAAVVRVRPGDRIAVEPAMPCRPEAAQQCDQCQVGRINTCRHLRFLGCPGQVAGCLAQYMVMPEQCCFPVAPHMSLAQAALVEPLSIGIYAVQQAGNLAGKRIGILGAGPIGLSTLLPALHNDAERVYVTDRLDYRLQAARRCGAWWTGNPDHDDVVGAVCAAEPLLLDIVFECCGEQAAIDQAVSLLKPGGKLMMIGIPKVDRIGFDIDQLRRKELAIQNVRRQAYCVEPALQMIADGILDVDCMLTHRFGFADTKAAFDLVAAYADGVIKAMIEL